MDDKTAYLQALLGQQFRIHTTDERVFAGELKCTDNECNVILAKAFEYRASPAARDASLLEALEVGKSKAVVNMSSRFLGLVVCTIVIVSTDPKLLTSLSAHRSSLEHTSPRSK